MNSLKEDRARCTRVLTWLTQQPDKGRQRNRVRKLLADAALHRSSAFHAISRTDALWDATPATVLGLAEQFNAFRPVIGEPILSRTVKKGSGTRTVHDFGQKRRMHQTAVARILRALHPPPGQQTLFRGGMPRALTAIEAAVAEGSRYGVEVDFVGFYASVRPEALPSLLRPLPTSVVDAVVWDRACRTHNDDVPGRASDPTSSSFEGLSLGSACSPIVGEIIIADLLAVAQLGDVVTFADNLFVFGRSDEDVVAKIQTLRDRVENQPFGELELRVPKERGFDLEWSFEFAKHEGILRGDTIEWTPGHRKLQQFQIREAAHLTLDKIDAAEARVVHWRRAYPDWHNGDAYAAAYRAGLAVRRFYLNRHPLHLQRAVDAVIVAYQEHRAIEPEFAGGLLAFIPREGDILGDGYEKLIAALERHIDRLAQPVAA